MNENIDEEVDEQPSFTTLYADIATVTILFLLVIAVLWIT